MGEFAILVTAVLEEDCVETDTSTIAVSRDWRVIGAIDQLFGETKDSTTRHGGDKETIP